MKTIHPLVFENVIKVCKLSKNISDDKLAFGETYKNVYELNDNTESGV